MERQRRGTQQEQFGRKAALTSRARRTADSYRLPERGTTTKASFSAMGAAPPSLTIPQAKARGRSRMQRNFSKWLENAQAALGWAVILGILAIASGVYLHQVSQTALIGRSAELLDYELASLRYENNQMRQEITFQQSLDVMEQRTLQDGDRFVRPVVTAEEYIRVVVPSSEAPPPPVIVSIERPPERFADALRIHLANFINTLGRGVANGE